MRRRRRSGPVIIAALVTVGALSGCTPAGSRRVGSTTSSAADAISLTVTADAVAGGRNSAEASWLTDTVIPGFVAAEKAKGVRVSVTFRGTGAGAQHYRAELEQGRGGDLYAADGAWLADLVRARRASPLAQVVGARAVAWSGWAQIPGVVQQNLTYRGQLYGIPESTDARLIYFNKRLFAEAGIQADWQPASWQDILDAGRKLRSVRGITPIQLDAGTAGGEATTTQGFLPLLTGAGAMLRDDSSGRWLGATPAVTDVLGFYRAVYGPSGPGDSSSQHGVAAHDQAVSEFAHGRVGMLIDSDDLWRSVICPDAASCGGTAMPDRDIVVGYALIPARSPGRGLHGLDYVSVSTGSGWLVNPAGRHPQQSWDLLTYMQSAQAQKARAKGQAQISARVDVNKAALAGDPFLTFVSTRVLPVTTYPPSDAAYPAVSAAVQQATDEVLRGIAPRAAALDYQRRVERAVGGPAHVDSG